MAYPFSSQYSVQVSEFWVRVMETLNTSDDIYAPVPGILQDTCEYFGFGCGFIYKADHTGTFFLHEYYLLYRHDHLVQTLDLRDELGGELAERLAGEKAILFSADKVKDDLEEAMGEVFQAGSMILIPICDEAGVLVAFVGLVDRRGLSRQENLDLGGAYAVLCTLANHIKLQLYQQRVENTEKAMRSVMDHMGIDIYVNDFETHEILYVNATMAQPYGGVEKLLGQKCWQALYTDKTGPCSFCPQEKLVDETGQPSKVYSWDYQRPFDGAWFRVFSAAFHWEDGRLAHVVSSVDITENKRNELIIRQMADYDTLTGLPNRRKLLADLDSRMENGQGYLLFFDLDGFKQVNDTYGHRAGDELLEKIGNMLQGSPMTEGRSYRHGGDEFVVVCHGYTLANLQQLLGHLLAGFSHPWHLAESKVRCGCSLGVARYPTDGTTPEELLHHADSAMYAAKQAGKGIIRFYHGGKCSRPKEYYEDLQL